MNHCEAEKRIINNLHFIFRHHAHDGDDYDYIERN